jgi:outer membrane protein assembly factor BamA
MHISAALIIRIAAGVPVVLLCLQAAPAHAQPQDRDVRDYRSEPQGLVAEPKPITRAAVFGDRHFGDDEAGNGYYIEFGNMIPGAGWISGGPGYRHWYSHDRVFVDASAAISWRGYKTAQGRFELPRLLRSRLALGANAQWHDFTQVAFFGEGPEAAGSRVSEYRLKSQNIVGYGTLRPVEWIAVDARIGWLKPSILPRAGTFKRDRPDTRDVFSRDVVFGVPEQPSFVHSDVAVTADTRDFPAHPTRGALVRGAAAHYSGRDFDLFTFRRYEAEAAHFLPLAGSRVVIATHGWLVASDTGEGRSVPFYLQPSLGGDNSLRGYGEYRFHDRNLMLLTVEARIAMMTHLDGAVFVDGGNVASRVADLNIDKRSYGAGLRLHTRRQTFARVDVARSHEGWRFLFRLTDPFRLSRISRRVAAAPFIP